MKTQKNIHLEPFLPILGQTRMFHENPYLSLFSVSRLLLLCRISEKLMNSFREKLVRDVQTDRWTDERAQLHTHGQVKFIVPPPLGVQKVVYL